METNVTILEDKIQTIQSLPVQVTDFIIDLKN